MPTARISTPYQQSKAAEVGGIKDVVEGDQGGHLFAAMFNGLDEQINYHPMPESLNERHGDWYNMEHRHQTGQDRGCTDPSIFDEIRNA